MNDDTRPEGVVARAWGTITPAGRAVTVLALASYIAGWWFGWVQAMTIAAGCVAALAIAAVWILGPMRLEVEREVHPDRLTVGEHAVALVRVTNRTSRRSRPTHAIDRVGTIRVPVEVPSLAPGASADTPYRIPTDRRGVVDIGPIVVAKADPLGLLRREAAQRETRRVWIWPRVLRVDIEPEGRARDLDGPTSDTSPEGTAAFHTLREYVPGDDFRRIHWRTSARNDRLMVKHFVDTRRPIVTLVLDNDAGAYADPAAFEAAVEVAAALGTAAVRASYPLHVFVPGTTHAAATPATGGSLLDALAEVELGGGPPLDQALESVDRRIARRTTMLAVVTGRTDADGVLDAVRRFGARPRWFSVSVGASAATEVGQLNLGNGRLFGVADADDFAARWHGARVR